MNQPTPAIVAQSAVRRLPRIALLLFCAAYVLPGFLGREPWKSVDMTSFGYMVELARGAAAWFSPTLAGMPPEFDALLPYWLGAWAVQLAPAWLPADFAARIPFGLLLVLTLASVWYSVYALARSPAAQPVAFAFGGEASPTDYARAMADGGLLALVATLGLAQLSHETTPSLAQLACTGLTFFGLAAMPLRPKAALPALLLGAAGLALSGAPAMALLFVLGGAAIELADPPAEAAPGERPWRWAVAALAAAALVIVLATALGLWRWRLGAAAFDARASGKLLLWFTWPAGPLAVWTLWRWRRQLLRRHVALPLWFALVAVGATLAGHTSDRSLLLGLPALAALAAFALPTLQRSVAALIDWFTLLFFSGCALIIWVIWISLQTGVPAKPAANVARLAPGFSPSFSLIAFVAALAGTLAWAWLVRWRTGRNQSAMWKSVVLPAAGTTLCWLLLMTLWLPVLDYARGYVPVVSGVSRAMDAPGCVEAFGLNRGQLAALRYHGNLELRMDGSASRCPWLVMPMDYQAAAGVALPMQRWQQVATVRRPTDSKDNLLVFKAVGSP